MKIDNIAVIYFSPTGGTEKVAKLIAGGLKAEGVLSAVDITVPGMEEINLRKNDLAVFCVPVYGGRVPSPVAERLSRISGSGTPCAVAAVFGNRAVGDALYEMRDMAVPRGFRVIAAGEFIAPHSVDTSIGAGRPDESDKRVIADFAARLMQKAESDSPPEAAVPGSANYVKYDGIPLKPSVSLKCVRCGVCAANCPVGAIDVINPRLTDKALCISCMRCIRICPRGARHVPAPMKLASSAMLKKLCAGRREPKLYF